MNFYAISNLITTILCAICGLTVFIHNPQSTKNRLFSIFCASVALWSFFEVFWLLSADEGSALFYIHSFTLFSVWIPSLYFHHILSLFNASNPFKRRMLFLSYAISVILFFSNFTSLYVSTTEPRGIFPFWPVPGPFVHLHLVSFVLSFILTFSLIFNSRRKTNSPLIKNQYSWLLLALSLGYFGGLLNFLFWYKIPIPPVANALIGIGVMITAFLFSRLRLFDIQLVFKDTTIHIMTAFLITGIYSSFSFPLLNNPLSVLSFLVLAIVMPHFYKPAYRWIHAFLNFIRGRNTDHYLKTVDATMMKIRESTYTYDDLAKNIVRSLLDTFPLQMSAVYFYNIEKKHFQLRAQKGMQNILTQNIRFNRTALAIPENDPLIEFLSVKKEPVVKHHLHYRETGPQVGKILQSMDRIEASACVPFLFAKKVKGILVVGPKKGNQPFRKEDIEALSSFGKMSEEVMRYIMGMETELQHTALYSHDMNNDTKSLVQTIQFLQSPLSKNQQRERIQLLLKQAEEVAQRLNNSFEMNADRSSLIMRSIKGDYEKTFVDIVDLLKISIGKFNLEAEKNQIAFNSDLPDTPYFVLGNADDLIRVFDNLISNGIRHVKKGGTVAIKMETENGKVKILFQDNGDGISAEDLPQIWSLGYQAQKGRRGATGFGLSIAKHILYLHQGDIQAFSDGLTQGTTFTILIPLAHQPLTEAVLNKS